MLDKIKTIIRVHHSRTGKFPKLSYLAKKLKTDKIKIIEFLDELEKQGMVKLQNNKYIFLKSNPKQFKVKSLWNGDLSIFFVRVVMGTVGISATFLSIYFSVIWFQEYLNSVMSFVAGITMVLFSVFAFETMIIFFKYKWFLLIVICSVVWLIVLSFSMMSTIGVLYNNQITYELEEMEQEKETAYASTEWEMYNSQERELLDLIAEKKHELEVTNILLEQFDNLELRTEKEDVWMSSLITKRKAEDKIEEYRNDLTEIRDKKLLFLKENQEKAGVIEGNTIQTEKSFYVGLEGITGITSMYIRFWLYAIPAVFVDILAPFGLAVALFLRKKSLISVK